MNFSIGDLISIKGERLRVVGKISYKNSVDGLFWDEYRLLTEKTGMEKWLSVDDMYKEYSISVPAEPNFPKERYHEVDRGVEVVVSHMGSVDVDNGESASFVEYEDATEEYIYSEETWSDGTERSKGYYLDADEIALIEHNEKAGKRYSSKSSSSSAGVIAAVMLFIFFLLSKLPAGNIMNTFFPKKIAPFLKSSSFFTYETSVTGSDSQKADVYSSFYDIDAAAKAILDAIEGNTESVQQNDEDGDNSIAILTRKEYCLVYEAEDGKTLVQVSNRKYVYGSRQQPYHCRTGTFRYYRRFYYSRGYYRDSSKYKKYGSSYDGFDDVSVGTNYSDTYSSYSNSVRQASTSSRHSSGGGTSYGK